MDSDELRKACKRARLDVAVEWGDPENGGGWGVYLSVGELHMMMDHPALPSYVADLLVGMVPGLVSIDLDVMPLPNDETEWRCTIWHGRKASGRTDATATMDEGRTVATIRAAMEVLGE